MSLDAGDSAQPEEMAAQTPASPVTRNEMRPVKYHYADTFWCTYIISVVSANIAELGVYICFILPLSSSAKWKYAQQKMKNTLLLLF